MNFMNYYNNLDTVDLVLIFGGIAVLIIIVGISIRLYIKNKQLMLLVKKQKMELDVKEKEIIRSRNNNSIKNNVVEDKVKILDKKEIKNDRVYKSNNSGRYQTSPINIVNKKEREEIKDNVSFTESLAKQMKEEIKPQTIELTEFEKKQEEEAIISYKELLSANKDKVYDITDDEETTDFIEELKTFRSNLD